MGFWSRFLGVDSTDPAQRVLPAQFEPFMSTGGIPVMDPGVPLEHWIKGHHSQVEEFWKSQPNLRKVVDYIARSVAGIPLNAYERVSDTERVRLSGEDLSNVLRSPVQGVAPYRVWHSVISDACLYDRWAMLKSREFGRLELVRIPAWRLHFKVDPLGRVTKVRYWKGDSIERGEEQWVDLDLEDIIFDHGYAPRSAGLSPVETLRDLLDESRESVGWRREMWENGPRMPAQVKRPSTAPKWESGQRDRFVTGMREFVRGGSKAGSMPLMEDGMEIAPLNLIKASDAMDLDGRKLSGIETSSAFHIAPELVGAREGNFSNIDAFRQMLYGPSLGPYVDAWQGVLNAQLVPEFANGRDIYIEANIESKLRGSFIEQSQIMQSATGAPWLTRNEARALQNRAPLAGGDDLVVPLNVLIGGQASPNDSGSQNRSDGPTRQIKAAPTKPERTKAEQVLSAFFKRQRSVVLSALGSKAADEWWDQDRWDRELSDDLLALSLTVTEQAAKRALDAAGGDEDAYDTTRTVKYLRAVTDRTAGSINDTTKAQIEDAIEDEDADPSEVFDEAEGSRSALAAVTLTTALASFATTEAGKQSGAATKTWLTGPNSRPEHAAMDGETVAISDEFSNGMAWPGDSSDADQVAGCNCSVSFDYP